MNPYAPPVEPPPSTPSEPTALTPELLALQARGDVGANWYFWIAGLSLVNTVVAHAGGDIHFVIGLAVTFVADHLARGIEKEAPETAPLMTVAAILFALLVTGMLVLCGWLSRKGWLPVMALGMALYLLDGLLCALLQDYMSAGFHAFALFQLMVGFNAYRQLKKLLRAPVAPQSLASVVP